MWVVMCDTSWESMSYQEFVAVARMTRVNLHMRSLSDLHGLAQV